MKPGIALLVAAVCVAGFSCEQQSPGFNPNDILELRLQIEELNKRVSALEEQVKSLEPMPLATPTDVPIWVTRGSVQSTTDPQVFYGLGSSKDVGSEPLTRSNAEKKASTQSGFRTTPDGSLACSRTCAGARHSPKKVLK